MRITSIAGPARGGDLGDALVDVIVLQAQGTTHGRVHFVETHE